MRMCKCTTMNVRLVWELREEQCFVAECVWEFMSFWKRVDRGSVRVVWELREVLWELLREVLWGYVREVKRRGQIFFASWETQTRQKTRWDLMGNRHDQPTWGLWPNLKIEFLRLGFTFSKLSLRDSSFKGVYVIHIHVYSTWNFTNSVHVNRASKARFTGPKSSLWDSRC